VSSLPSQLALSALVMGAVVGGLFFIGQNRRAAAGSSERPAASGQPSSTTTGPAPSASLQPDARALLPARSLLVVDFEGRLTGASPFARGDAGCQSVPPPERVGVALVASKGPSPDARPGEDLGMALVLVSPAVSADFWRCVRLEVEHAGGQALATSPPEEALASPSGVLVHRAGRLLFASDRALLGELSELARNSAPTASSSPPHSQLAERIRGQPAALLATLSLPPNWLDGVGPEASQSPIRHLLAGALRTDADGGALGELECAEPGCEELVAFLLRARADLGAALPVPLGQAAVRSWTAARQPLSETRGLIRLRWVPGDVSFSDWASGVWQNLSARGEARGEARDEARDEESPAARGGEKPALGPPAP